MINNQNRLYTIQAKLATLSDFKKELIISELVEGRLSRWSQQFL